MRGFTLVEVVIVSGLILIIGTLLAGIMINNTRVYNKETSMVAQGLNINDAFREIETYARGASGVVSGYPEGSPAYVTGTNTLVLKVPAINNQGIISDVYDFVIFTEDASDPKFLKEYIFPDAESQRGTKNVLLTNFLDSVVFEYLDKNDLPIAPTSAVKIKATVNVLSKMGSQTQQRSSTIVTSLRNL